MSLLNAQDVGDLLSLRTKQVYQLARQGIVPAVRVGRLLRFDADALDRWIAAGGQGFDAGWRQRSNEDRSTAHSARESGREIEPRTQKIESPSRSGNGQ